MLHTLIDLLSRTVPDMPLEVWWMPAIVLIVLAFTAIIDAFTAIVPDLFVFAGLFFVALVQAFYVSSYFMIINFVGVGAAGLLIWAVDKQWRKTFKKKALGMGDAKWTMLAVACFGALPSLIAWGLAACLGVVWIGMRKLVCRPADRVHFAPFLFLGLLAGIWWVRLKGGDIQPYF